MTKQTIIHKVSAYLARVGDIPLLNAAGLPLVIKHADRVSGRHIRDTEPGESVSVSWLDAVLDAYVEYFFSVDGHGAWLELLPVAVQMATGLSGAGATVGQVASLADELALQLAAREACTDLA